MFILGSCLVGKGQSYSDNINVTESGRPCISWNLQDFYQSSMFPELRTAGKSCRNPGGISKKPWCYVNLTSNAAVRWEYCDIEKCRKFAVNSITFAMPPIDMQKGFSITNVP